MSLSINSYAFNSSTGRLEQDSICNDSVNVSICDLRKVNGKLVELKYEKEINDSLRSIVSNDDKIIRHYNNQVNTLNKQITQIKKERDIARWGGIGAAILLVISLVIK